MSWPRATTTSEDDAARHPRRRRGRRAGARDWPTPRAATTSPTPSSNTPCTRTWASPVGRGRTDRWPRRSRTSAATVPAHGSVSWPATGSTPPNPSTWPRPSTTPARRATPLSARSLPPTRCATTPRPSTSTPRPTTPIRSSGSTWPSGSAPPNARPATPPFARRSSTPPAGPPTSATPTGSWPPPWPTTGARHRAVGVIDADKVEILEMALDRLADRRPRPGARARHPVRGAHLRQPARTPPGARRRGHRHRRGLR